MFDKYFEHLYFTPLPLDDGAAKFIWRSRSPILRHIGHRLHAGWFLLQLAHSVYACQQYS